jgi:spermidine/putrescine transport system substrate-binding protein
MIKRFSAFLIALILILTVMAPMVAAKPQNDYSHLKGTTLNVYNWGEYISDGSEGSLDVNKAFEEKYGIKVNYTNYESNENMYNKLKSGGADYDVVIPSDYMIAKLIEEDMLAKLNFDNIPNAQYIVDDYKGLYYDPTNEYTVPYTVGMVGLIYNTTMVEGSPDSWGLMWDERYAGQILMFNNPRDAFGIAQFYLGQSVNSTNPRIGMRRSKRLKSKTA